MGEEQVCRLCWELARQPPPHFIVWGYRPPTEKGEDPGRPEQHPAPAIPAQAHPEMQARGLCSDTPSQGPCGGLTQAAGALVRAEGKARAPSYRVPQGRPGWGLGHRGCWVAPGSLSLGPGSQSPDQRTFEGPVPIAAQMGWDEAAASRMSGQAGSVQRLPLRVGSSRGNCGCRYLGRMPHPRTQRCPRCPTEG